MSANQFLIDAASRRAVFVQRLSKSFERDLTDELQSALSDAQDAILDSNINSISDARRLILLELAERFSIAEQALFDQVEEFALEEAEFSLQMLDKATNQTPSAAPNVTAGLSTTPLDLEPGNSYSVRSSLARFSERKVKQVERVIADGITRGETSESIATGIAAIVPLQMRQARSTTRTAVNAASSLSRMETLKANKGLFLGMEWVSTLDSRTTLICMNRDGKIYPISDSAPIPPAHWACRSTIVPKVKPQFDLGSEIEGDRPAIGSDGAKQVGAKTTYSGWLKKQSKSFQESALGIEKAKLFRSGALTLDAFVDPTGEEYTLKELRRLYPLAFD